MNSHEWINMGGETIALPAENWRRLFHGRLPAERGHDAIVALGRKADFSKVLILRWKISEDPNGFSTFQGCHTDSAHAREVVRLPSRPSPHGGRVRVLRGRVYSG
jgi:hypothetical protein